MRRRSRTVALAILGASAFALAGCKEEETEARAFPDVASCKAAANAGSLYFSAQDCDAAFAQASTDQLETAPRYADQAACEAEHGVGNCGSQQVAQNEGGGMGSFFMPMIAGFLIGQMLGGRGIMSQPLSRTPDGKFQTPGGTQVATNNGAGKMSPSTFTKAPSQVGKAPLTQADVAKRGGFGATGTTRAATSGSTSGSRTLGG